MQTQDIVETWRREAVQEGVKQGLEAGVKQGLEAGVKQGLEAGVACSLIDLYEARFGAVPDDLRAIIDDMHDEAMLRGWVKLAGTRGVDEVTAAIRAAHPA